MVPILNKLQLFWISRRIKSYQTKNDFYSNYLPIKLDEMESKKDYKLKLLSLKKRDKLLKYEINAGIKSDYVDEVYNDKLQKLKDRYYWKRRALAQKLKRKNSDDKSQLEAFDQKSKEVFENLKLEYYKEPTKEAKNLYDLKKLEIETSYTEKTKNLEQKIVKKINDTKKRITLKVKKYKSKEEGLKKKLSTLNKATEKHNLDENIVLKLDNLSMHFGGLKAVDELSFEVKEGEIFGLIGPNGAGKTTVFNCITRFYRPTNGDMYFSNKLRKTVHLNKIKVHNVVKEGVSRTFQNVEMVWELNVIENLLVAAHSNYRSGFFGHMFNSKLLRQEDAVMRKKANKILEDLDLAAYAYAYPYGLPYGILKRIELARTLMIDPKMIILDEPAAGLNDAETDDLEKTIKKIQKEYNATIFLVEHDMGLVMNICDTVCAISFGKKLAIGTPKEIQNSKIVQEAYLGGE